MTSRAAVTDTRPQALAACARDVDGEGAERSGASHRACPRAPVDLPPRSDQEGSRGSLL
jgi:hypothetical protein